MFSKVLSMLSYFNISENFHSLSLHQPSPASLPLPKLINFPWQHLLFKLKRNKAGDLMLSKALAQNMNLASSLPYICAYWLNNEPIHFCHNLSQFDLDFMFLVIKSMLNDTMWKRYLLPSLNLTQFLPPIPGHMSSSDAQLINYLILRPQKARGMVRFRAKAGLGDILVILLAKGKKKVSFCLGKMSPVKMTHITIYCFIIRIWISVYIRNAVWKVLVFWEISIFEQPKKLCNFREWYWNYKLSSSWIMALQMCPHANPQNLWMLQWIAILYLFTYLLTYLLIFGCIGSSLLHAGFL